MPTRLQLARSDIVRFFKGAQQHVYKQRELEQVLAAHRDEWRLAQRMSFQDFLAYLLKSVGFKRFDFAFPHRSEVRFAWGKVSLFAVLQTLKPNCHFSHYTAMQLHELTEQDPTTIYINHEQTPKPASSMGLAQERIDLAFRRKPRTTKNVALVTADDKRKLRVCLLNGMHTRYVGVEERRLDAASGNEPTTLRLTDIERTLIDIAVRPFYAGEVSEVLKAYRLASGKASVNRLAGTLRQIGYVYPYHQAIGFYLEASGGYDQKFIDLFYDSFHYDFDFYLTYDMRDTEYVKRWRLHVPRGLASIR